MTKKKIKEVSPVVAYKGFGMDWKCRGYQFAVGATYKHEGPVVRCATGGFHSCEFPLDVFSYYPPSESRYAVVEASGDIDRDDSDTKIASASITITAEITLPKLVQYAVDWITTKIDRSIEQTVSSNQSAATNTGDQSAATNTGHQSAATNTGDQSAATNTGDQSAATNTGYRSAATNTGYRSAATNTGDQSAAANTGYQSAASVEGKHSVAISTGYEGRAKASETGAICLVYRDENYNLIHIRAARVGQDGIKADTWYSLNANGDFVEVS
jgi:hypothetical protein